MVAAARFHSLCSSSDKSTQASRGCLTGKRLPHLHTSVRFQQVATEKDWLWLNIQCNKHRFTSVYPLWFYLFFVFRPVVMHVMCLTGVLYVFRLLLKTYTQDTEQDIISPALFLHHESHSWATVKILKLFSSLSKLDFCVKIQFDRINRSLNTSD